MVRNESKSLDVECNTLDVRRFAWGVKKKIHPDFETLMPQLKKKHNFIYKKFSEKLKVYDGMM